MSKYHTTLSRREFMKAIGLAGAGLGAAAAVVPVIHDLDELPSLVPTSNWQKPWFVAEREAYNPTVEADWDMIQPWKRGPTNPKRTPPALAMIEKYGAEQEKYHGQDRYDLKYSALRNAASYHQESCDWTGYSVRPPEEGGFAKYDGGPEDNAAILRAAFHFLGCPETHYLDLTEKSHKLITKDAVGFQNVSTPYQHESGVKVIPDTCRTFVTVLGRKEISCTRHGMGEPYGYSSSTMVERNCQVFLKGLGYHAVRAQEQANSSIAILAGGAELGRVDHAVSPRYGTAIKKHGVLLTDMPLPAEKPIDAGIFKFCHTCKVCAELCHVQGSTALSIDDEPTWELPNRSNLSLGVSNPFDFKRPGLKNFKVDYASCRCAVHCWRNCVFNQLNAASAHDFIRATVATTPIFNGVFAQLDRLYEYGARTYEETIEGTKEWWARDLNTRKWDTIPSGDCMP